MAARCHHQLATLHEVGKILVAEGLPDELRLAREVVARDPPAPRRRHHLEDALLRLLVGRLRDRLLHGANTMGSDPIVNT